MHRRSSDNNSDNGFKRQVVFRVGSDDWALLQQAATAHGSIQAALLAAIRAHAGPPPNATAPAGVPATVPEPDTEPSTDAAPAETDTPDDGEEISAREAATLLGLKSSTVKGYIRSGRLPGRYDTDPTWRGWLTTRAAVTDYTKQR